jgi:hypothetical protein
MRFGRPLSPVTVEGRLIASPTSAHYRRCGPPVSRDFKTLRQQKDNGRDVRQEKFVDTEQGMEVGS